MIRPVVCASLAFLAISVRAQAYGPTAKSDRQASAILGIVADSLHGGPLVQAVVTVVQLPRKSVMTSSSGAFRIDSLPPGRYTLEIQHAVIDSLGIQLISDTLTVAAGETQTVLLSVPSAARIAATVCSPQQRQLGPAALIGHVLDADTDKPAAGTQVSVAWLETEVSKQVGVHTMPRVRKAIVAPDGTYRLCGLPPTLNATLQASFGTAKTAEVAIQTTEEILTLKFLRLPLQQAPPADHPAQPTTSVTTSTAGSTTAQPAPLQTGHAVVTGQVTTRGGAPVEGARVTVQGATPSTASGKDGNFTLSGVPAGTQLVLVRQVGYDPVQLPLDITTRGPNRIAVQLGEYHAQLATVHVPTKVPPSDLDRTGFPRRKRSGMGRYITEDDIEKEQPVYTSDVLRHINGLHILGSGQNVSVTTSRGDGCVQYLVDRNSISPNQGVSIDELVRPDDIAAIEFYQPLEIPLELTGSNSSGCALVVIWTRSRLKPLQP